MLPRTAPHPARFDHDVSLLANSLAGVKGWAGRRSRPGGRRPLGGLARPSPVGLVSVSVEVGSRRAVTAALCSGPSPPFFPVLPSCSGTLVAPHCGTQVVRRSSAAAGRGPQSHTAPGAWASPPSARRSAQARRRHVPTAGATARAHNEGHRKMKYVLCRSTSRAPPCPLSVSRPLRYTARPSAARASWRAAAASCRRRAPHCNASGPTASVASEFDLGPRGWPAPGDLFGGPGWGAWKCTPRRRVAEDRPHIPPVSSPKPAPHAQSKTLGRPMFDVFVHVLSQSRLHVGVHGVAPWRLHVVGVAAVVVVVQAIVDRLLRFRIVGVHLHLAWERCRRS